MAGSAARRSAPRVGYRIRFENRTSARTRIEVVTEGILTRMIQDDPMLDGVGALLFDEFHERHLAPTSAWRWRWTCRRSCGPTCASW
jgi:ATP-dependent helicase HrpB